MKKCSKCKEEKPFEEFSRDKRKKDGRRSNCKECRRQYYENNKEKILEREKQRYQNNKEKRKQYLENNKEKIREKNKQWYENNKEKRKQYLENNREKIREVKNKYQKQKRKNDPEFRLRHNIRGAFYKFLNGKKEKSTSEYLKQCGYTRKELVKHLEDQFDQNMTWDNYGSYWHVDHVIPKSAFEPTNEQHLKWCWSLENLRPLEASENMSKNNRITLEEVEKISFYEDIKHLLKD